MKGNSLYYPIIAAQSRPIILKKSLMYSLIVGICVSHSIYGQAVKNGSYVGLEDMHYSSHEKHIMFKWYHLTHVTIANDSVWVDQDPIAIHKHDTIFSASDGAFYYYEGTVSIKGKQITLNLWMTNCDYCGIPEDSARREQFFRRIWSGQTINDGIMIDSSFYSRCNREAMRWRRPSNE